MKAALERWLSAEDADAAVPRFRRVFCAVTLAYDVVDVALGATEHEGDWCPHPSNTEMLLLQLGLIACGVCLVLGRWVYVAGIASAGLRFWQARIFGLNDFHFFAVVTLLVAHGDGGPFKGGPKHPKWVRDVLLAQVAFVYAATAWLKLGPSWIGGDGIFVRTTFLREGNHWPYPGFVARALASKTVDAWLARAAVVAEFSLAAVLAVRRPYWMAVALCVGIHTFGALATNVWFFSAAMLSCVVLLVPRSRRREEKKPPGAPGAE